jgi:ABC-2 type transport system permease protein
MSYAVQAARTAPTARRGSLRGSLHAEWTKLRTLPGAAWLLVVMVGLTAALGVAADAAGHCPVGRCGLDPAKTSLTGIYAGQVIAAILGAAVITGEYGTGMIRITLAATPARTAVLVAKGIIVAGLTLAAGAVAVLGSVLAGQFILPGHGFTAAHGFAAFSLSDGRVLRAAVGSVFYLALVALLSLGIATAVRDSAVAIGVVLGLLYLAPIVGLIAGPNLDRHLEQIAPMPAGLAIEATTNLQALAISPWAGLGVLAAWAAGALLAGGLTLRLRDA